jgi:hypothetical protein
MACRRITCQSFPFGSRVSQQGPGGKGVPSSTCGGHDGLQSNKCRGGRNQGSNMLTRHCGFIFTLGGWFYYILYRNRRACRPVPRGPAATYHRYFYRARLRQSRLVTRTIRLLYLETVSIFEVSPLTPSYPITCYYGEDI